MRLAGERALAVENHGRLREYLFHLQNGPWFHGRAGQRLHQPGAVLAAGGQLAGQEQLQQPGVERGLLRGQAAVSSISGR
jgi:hypothetical protein